jgi:translation initiation factor IF-2
MGIKRRSMFNPKFKASRPERWELGRRMKGLPTEKELEEQRLEEEKVALAAEAAIQAEMLATQKTQELMLAQERAQREAEEKRLVEEKTRKEAAEKAAFEKKKAIPAKKKESTTSKKRTTTSKKKTSKAKKTFKG